MRFIAVILCILLAITPASDTYASNKKKKPASDHNPRYAALVIDANTREVLFQRHAKSRRYPASLTKMMTLYLTFEALAQNKVQLSTTMKASHHAASQPRTNLALKAGDRITVDQAIRGLVVHSANDASVVLAEHLGGSEQRFATLMTKKAHALGMKDTQFRNPNGLPNKQQYTTAHDMAILALALKRRFPEYYAYFKVTNFTFKGTPYKSHNRVVQRFAGADGIKTGFIRDSGFNLVTSAERNGRRLIGVVMGGRSSQTRDDHMIELLDNAFRTIGAGTAPARTTESSASTSPKVLKKPASMR